MRGGVEHNTTSLFNQYRGNISLIFPNNYKPGTLLIYYIYMCVCVNRYMCVCYLYFLYMNTFLVCLGVDMFEVHLEVCRQKDTSL